MNRTRTYDLHDVSIDWTKAAVEIESECKRWATNRKWWNLNDLKIKSSIFFGDPFFLLLSHKNWQLYLKVGRFALFFGPEIYKCERICAHFAIHVTQINVNVSVYWQNQFVRCKLARHTQTHKMLKWNDTQQKEEKENGTTWNWCKLPWRLTD